MGLLTQYPRAIDERAWRDAFQRLRISNPETIFDSKLLVSDQQTLLWDDQQTTGAGTSSTYQSTDACFRMAVSNATAGTRVRQTFRRFNYQPGKSQLVMMTFNFTGTAANITKRLGLFDGTNGLFFQASGTTPAFVIRKAGGDRVFTQTNWNSDQLNGSGPSGLTLDLTKAQIFFTDFEWLGVGTVRFGFIINGQFVICHTEQHANVATAVFMSSPNLPLRYELSNSGAGVAATMDCICSQVTVEGGISINGVQFSADRAITPLTTANATTLYPILGLRLKSTHLSASIHPLAAAVACASQATFRWVLCFNPTLAGTAVVWNDKTNSSVQVATPTKGTTVSAEGTQISAGYAVQAGGYNPNGESSLIGFLALGANIAGTPDQLWLCAQRITGTTEDFYASIVWREEI